MCSPADAFLRPQELPTLYTYDIKYRIHFTTLVYKLQIDIPGLQIISDYTILYPGV